MSSTLRLGLVRRPRVCRSRLARRRAARGPAPVRPSIVPQELARIWDAEHVSPPPPPLLTHADVVQRLEAVVSGRAGSLFRMEKVGESVEGRAINLVQAGTGRVSRAALVADARRRADRDGGAVRHLRVPAAPPRGPGGPRHALVADAVLHADAQSRRRRAVSAAQRAGHRHQSRRARGCRRRRAARSRRSAIAFSRASASTCTTRAGARRWATPPKPASISLLSVAFDEGALGKRRADAHEEGLRGHPRCARAVRVRARSDATTTSSRCGRSATTSRCGARRWC